MTPFVMPLPRARVALDSHPVERSPHENRRPEDEHPRQHVAQQRAVLFSKLHAKFHREQSEQRRELDDRIHRHRRRVLERIADRVADDRRGMQRRALLLQLDLDHFLGVVPRAAGVGHEDRLEQTEERDRDQVADEEVRLEEGKPQRGEKHRQEDVEHPLLRVLRADLDDFLAVRDRAFSPRRRA